MHRAHDPALFLSVYLEKYLPKREPATANRVGSLVDARLGVLKQVDSFADKYGLKPSPQGGAAEVDLDRLDTSSESYLMLARARTEYPKPPVGTYSECLVYAYHDALIIQIVITKFADWLGTLNTGWNELSNRLRSGFDGTALNAAQSQTLGASVVYWAIADDEDTHPEAYAREVREIADGKDLQQTHTDVGGPLWRCDQRIFPDSPAIPQDLWMLITPRSAEKEVNRRYNRPRVGDPPDFPIVALSRHKITYERTKYLKERQNLRHARHSLDQRADEIVELQRNLGPELDELRSREGFEFQQKLAHAAAGLADYSYTVGKLKELRHTVVVNRRNYLINSVALLSSHGAEKVERSIDQEAAASNFLANLPHDEIFGSDVGSIQGLCQQLDSEIDYANSLIERHTASLRSGGEQLRIAGERELGEMAHHLSVDSAAVVASVVAVIVVETVIKPLYEHPETPSHNANRWDLALWLVVGSFAATQLFSSGGRGRSLERWSSTFAFGFFAGYLATLGWTAVRLQSLADANFWDWRNFGVLIIGALAGWIGHLLLSRRKRT